MRKLIISLGLLIVSGGSVFAQEPAVSSQLNVWTAPQRFKRPFDLDCRVLSGEPLSAAGRAKIGCDSASNTLKASINGGAFSAFGGGGSSAWGAITGTLSAQTDLQSALNLKAPLTSPALLGTPTAPTATGGTNTTQIATTAFVQTAVAGVSVPVQSVFGRTGTVGATNGDYTAAQVTVSPSVGGNSTGQTALADHESRIATNTTNISTNTSSIAAKAPSSRSIATTAPITGGGDLSSDRTIGISITTTNNGGAIALQSSTPGTVQTGHLNISGTIIGGAFTGNLVGNVTGTVSGNSGTTTALQNARTINGVSFDGTGNIVVPAAAGTLTGSTLAAGVGVPNAQVTGLSASATIDTTNASNISSGTLAAARGGAGAVSGALKANGSGVVSQAACGDLSNASALCSSADAANLTGTVAAARLPNPTSSSLGGVQSFAAQSNKFLTSVSTSGVPVAAQPDVSNLSTSGALGGNLDLGMNAMAIEIANEGVTGTTTSKLVKLTGAPSTGIVAGTSDTAGVLGLCVSGCTTTGNAVVARAGQANCVFDGATTAGDYVQISSTVAGDCHDTGLTAWPTTGGQVIGRVLSTNGAGGTFLTTLHIGTQAIPAAGATNAAGNNVITKSNGTNIVASGVSDDGTTITTSEAVTQTSASASAFVSGANGATNPGFKIDNSTASAATGVTVKPAAAGAGVTLMVTSSGSNDNLVLTPKGTGALISTGPIQTSGVGSLAAPAYQFGASQYGWIMIPATNYVAWSFNTSQYILLGGPLGYIAYDTAGFNWSSAANTTINTGVNRIANGVVSIDTSTPRNGAGTVHLTNIEIVAGANVASASAITPTSGLFHVTGTTQITNINLPRTGYTGCIRIIPDAAFTTATGGNIALASTAIVNRILEECFDGTNWFPSY